MQARSYQDQLCTKNSHTLEHSASKYQDNPNSEDLQRQTQTLGAEDSPHLGEQKIYFCHTQAQRVASATTKVYMYFM
jgi:hypothetical protein